VFELTVVLVRPDVVGEIEAGLLELFFIQAKSSQAEHHCVSYGRKPGGSVRMPGPPLLTLGRLGKVTYLAGHI
jgi:hypothetical protein